MLCSRSASLMSTTRMSSAIARNIFRMFSACCCSWVWVLNLDSLVTPSTRCAISGPNRSSTSARLYSVSSGTSCSSAAATATGSMPRSARICAEAIGCVTYGSPDARTWRAVRLDGEVEGALGDREVGLRVVGLADRGEQPRLERVERRAAARGPGAVRDAVRDRGLRRSSRGGRRAWSRGASRGTSGSRTTGSAMHGVYPVARSRPGAAPGARPLRGAGMIGARTGPFAGDAPAHGGAR